MFSLTLQQQSRVGAHQGVTRPNDPNCLTFVQYWHPCSWSDEPGQFRARLGPLSGRVSVVTEPWICCCSSAACKAAVRLSAVVRVSISIFSLFTSLFPHPTATSIFPHTKTCVPLSLINRTTTTPTRPPTRHPLPNPHCSDSTQPLP